MIPDVFPRQSGRSTSSRGLLSLRRENARGRAATSPSIRRAGKDGAAVGFLRKPLSQLAPSFRQIIEIQYVPRGHRTLALRTARFASLPQQLAARIINMPTWPDNVGPGSLLNRVFAKASNFTAAAAAGTGNGWVGGCLFAIISAGYHPRRLSQFLLPEIIDRGAFATPYLTPLRGNE